jgi:hypothetical protein
MDHPTNLRVLSRDTRASARATAGLRINGVFDPCKPADYSQTEYNVAPPKRAHSAALSQGIIDSSSGNETTAPPKADLPSATNGKAPTQAIVPWLPWSAPAPSATRQVLLQEGLTSKTSLKHVYICCECKEPCSNTYNCVDCSRPIHLGCGKAFEGLYRACTGCNPDDAKPAKFTAPLTSNDGSCPCAADDDDDSDTLPALLEISSSDEGTSDESTDDDFDDKSVSPPPPRTSPPARRTGITAFFRPSLVPSQRSSARLLLPLRASHRPLAVRATKKRG